MQLPLDISKYQAASAKMSDREVRAFMALLIMEWQRCGLPRNPMKIYHLAASFEESQLLRECSNVITEYFITDGNRRYYPHFEQIRQKKRELSEKRRSAGKKGAAKRYGKTDNAPELIDPGSLNQTFDYRSTVNRFLQAYPRSGVKSKVTRELQEAVKRLIKSTKCTQSEAIELIMYQADKYAKSNKSTETRYIKLPQNWLIEEYYTVNYDNESNIKYSKSELKAIERQQRKQKSGI